MSPDRRIDLTSEARDHLRVDAFLSSFLHARALKSALELGLIDALHAAALSSAGPLDRDSWALHRGADTRGITFLCDLLAASGVLANAGPALSLSPAFRAAFRWRDLLEAKLDFCGVVLADLAQHGSDWFAAPQCFQQQARAFALFDYARCLDITPHNEARARAWMRLTTALTRGEAAACAEAHDFGAHRHLLDVGGNSGEFAASMCARFPGLQATVLDLPVVCHVGRSHLQGRAEAARVRFVEGDARRDDQPWPTGADIVSFKSMLHDWPEADARRFLARAFATLPPGGTVLVIERGPLPPPPPQPSSSPDATAPMPMPPFSTLPVLVFFRAYREAAFYTAAMHEAGFVDAQAVHFDLDMPFYAVSARKPS